MIGLGLVRTSLFYKNPLDVSESVVEMTESSRTPWPSKDFSTLLKGSTGVSVLSALDAQSLQNLSLTSKSLFATTQRHMLRCSVEQRVSLLDYARQQLISASRERADRYQKMVARRRWGLIGVGAVITGIALAWLMLDTGDIRLGESPTARGVAFMALLSIYVVGLLSLLSVVMLNGSGCCDRVDLVEIADSVLACRRLRNQDFSSYPLAIKATVLGALQHMPSDDCGNLLFAVGGSYAVPALLKFEIRDDVVWLVGLDNSQRRANVFEIEQLLENGLTEWQHHICASEGVGAASAEAPGAGALR